MNQWIDWVKRLQAISQTGKAYSKDKFDLERFDEIAAISHQMLAELAEEPVAKIENLFIPESGYPTPKVDLRAGVIKDNKILLVREREDNCWTLPGGWADVCETPSQGIIREVYEESGFKVCNPKLVAIKDRDSHPYIPKYAQHIYKFFFLCTFESGVPLTNIEISDIDFFERDKLPELSKSRVLSDDIELMFKHHQQPASPVWVD
ncbi:ADP-ribose pyrophosphatase [Vibrio panuliri]|uniref:ADP-ribose pyrophosphatase n=1 Tax=Vibrio panuliri TaxID=1381081 RepID=A0A1Q9HR10_9VIBR|nr:NUDIX hydrolase [Vibrio panuliri]OLQ93291.1 ADP-ribose pyrophosphatase [Vibrio panuliri]